MTAGVTTLATVRTTCQQRTDNVNSSFISTAEWNSWIQASYQELYGLVVEAYGQDYYAATTYSFTTDGTNQLFALPADFFKLLGVDLQIAGSQFKLTLKPFPFSERNRYLSLNGQTPQAGQTVNLYYVPRLTLPTLDADTIDGVNGWEEYIVNDVCIKAMAKEESDTQPFVLAKAAMVARLEHETMQRDIGMPARIGDVTLQIFQGMRYRIYGSNIWLIGNVFPGLWPLGDWDGTGGAWW